MDDFKIHYLFQIQAYMIDFNSTKPTNWIQYKISHLIERLNSDIVSNMEEHINILVRTANFTIK